LSKIHVLWHDSITKDSMRRLCHGHLGNT